VELTGRGDYIQPWIQSNKLRKRLSALRSNELFGGAIAVSYYFLAANSSSSSLWSSFVAAAA
jgi:hypothetical protein